MSKKKASRKENPSESANEGVEKAVEESNGQQPDFETSLEELEQLVEALESGELSLAESLERFKRGVDLSKHCHGMLDQARQSVELLTRPDDEESAEAFDRPEN